VHAILLQMAAAKLYGPADSGRFDPLTIGLPHGDAATALIAGGTEVNNHFSAPPFQYLEAKAAGVRRVTTAQDILGTPATYMVAYATEKFRSDNPKLYGVFVATLQESIDAINKDPRTAAKDYIEASKDPISVDDAVAMMTDPGAKFTMAPDNVMTFAEFMFRQGLIKNRPAAWHGHKRFTGQRYSVQLNYMTTDAKARSELRRHRISAFMKRLTRAA